ncbi:uncharacterized protein LOC126973001 [Leptidea sinapis]|uniref:uncharacterized protein LOC126973001 n=1 Tax=Leptidea sinapis TaxID=189913 RepID=UPI002124A9A9|nr:uncharacterized protein LOC126973001 [Leptidea sinapis]
MGLLLSVIITYAGVNDAIECIKHIISGIVPNTDPDFQDLVEHYARLLRGSVEFNNECGNGYLVVASDENGTIKSASVKFYGGNPHSTALLFSTKISSFGEDSFEDNSRANGDYRIERSTKPKAITSESSGSFSVGKNISNSNDSYQNEQSVKKERLSWEYIPKAPSPQPLPEFSFQSYEDDRIGDIAFSDKFLRSLDGINRNDPSFRRKTFRKRKSSSSNSSRDSRASREEELKMFTSLEEAEFKSMNNENNYSGFGSAPNLAARSYSRSRSRERSNERKNVSFNDHATADDERLNLRQNSVPRLGSFEEKDEAKENEVKQTEDVDFWSNIAE